MIKYNLYFRIHTSGLSKMISNIYSLIIVLAYLTLISGCKNNPNEPKENISPAGRRDYVWTVDTLSNLYPYNSYYSIWGTSATDLWCIGEGGDIDKMILHYDGISWKNFAYTGQGMEPWSIFGFSANDFGVGRGDGDIFRYTNGQFNKIGDYRLPGFPQTVLMKFWGNSPNDIYAVGTAEKTTNGRLYEIIMHYDGNIWNYVIKPELFPASSSQRWLLSL